MQVSARSQQACVVVPIYRSTLLPYEQVALGRCDEVLESHDVVLAKPTSLDLASVLTAHPRCRVESFDDAYFKGVAGYNRLMLSDEFYARFEAYEYILIHQLDAFVFKDELGYWCDRGYDYIGAPWLPDSSVPSRLDLAKAAARRKLSRLVNRLDANAGGMHATQYMFSVGNGGFSLRRVRSMRRVLSALGSRTDDYRQARMTLNSEDLFFAVEVNRYWPRLRIPDLKVAAGFSWERNPAVARILNGGSLPFGCHAWNKLHRDDWAPVFEEHGYPLGRILDA